MSSDRNEIYDPMRQQWVADMPEERVRQAMVHYLHTQLNYPKSFIANEYSITIGKVSRRCDTVVFTPELTPLMVIEYKAPTVQLSDSVIEQVFRYNSVLMVPVIVIANGVDMRVYKVGYHGAATELLPAIPTYPRLLELGSATSL